MSRAKTPDPRGLRIVAPIGLVLAVVAIMGTVWWLAGDLQVGTVTVPVDAPADVGATAIPERGTVAFAIIQSDTLSEDTVELVDAITAQSESVPGITSVESVTNVGVLLALPTGALTTTPPFGSASALDPFTSLDARARRAATGLLGTAGLVTEDGRAFMVTAEIDPALAPEQQATAARSFRDRATLAGSVSGLPVTLSFGGQALTVAEATENTRADLALLVGLACLAPAAIALVVLRRRVPAGALLAAGGAALLLASILVNGEGAQGRVAPLDRDHPLARANDLADRDLRRTIPVTIDITGATGAFRRPEVLARMDALTTWLRGEYAVDAIDLPTTLRAEAGAITGVDSIPSNPEDIDRLLNETGTFANRLIEQTTNSDLSRTRIVAWLPDEGRARIDELASRLDRISVVVFEDLGISVRVGADVIATTPTRQVLAKDLALLGMLAVALGALVALATLWDRHRHEERHRERHRRLFGPTGRHPAAGSSGSRSRSAGTTTSTTTTTTAVGTDRSSRATATATARTTNPVTDRRATGSRTATARRTATRTIGSRRPAAPARARADRARAMTTSVDHPAPVDLVIFDCDGVLVDSERLAVRVESRLLTSLGWPLTEDEVLDRFVGRSDAYMLGEIERALGREVPEWTERYQGDLHAAFHAELVAVDGVADAIDLLDVTTCVASSGTHDKMRLTLGLTGLHDRFAGRIYSATEVTNGKPAPDLFLHAARSMGVEPDRCVVVEDSRSGVEAARGAGMRSLGFAGGLTPADWLAGPGTVVFQAMADLPVLVDALREGRDR